MQCLVLILIYSVTYWRQQKSTHCSSLKPFSLISLLSMKSASSSAMNEQKQENESLFLDLILLTSFYGRAGK